MNTMVMLGIHEDQRRSFKTMGNKMINYNTDKIWIALRYTKLQKSRR